MTLASARRRKEPSQSRITEDRIELAVRRVHEAGGVHRGVARRAQRALPSVSPQLGLELHQQLRHATREVDEVHVRACTRLVHRASGSASESFDPNESTRAVASTVTCSDAVRSVSRAPTPFRARSARERASVTTSDVPRLWMRMGREPMHGAVHRARSAIRSVPASGRASRLAFLQCWMGGSAMRSPRIVAIHVCSHMDRRLHVDDARARRGRRG